MREKDLQDRHKPDLFYFDGRIPFGRTGRKLIAYHNNSNMKISKWNPGSKTSWRITLGLCRLPENNSCFKPGSENLIQILIFSGIDRSF